MNIQEQIQEWNEAGDATKIIRAKLTIAGIDDKAITALLKEAGIGRNTAGFTQTNTLKALEAGISEYDLYEIILVNGAKNEARWIGDRNRIRVTMNRIYSNLDSPVTEEAATESQKEQIKTLLGK
jgi:hypothetical protein